MVSTWRAALASRSSVRSDRYSWTAANVATAATARPTVSNPDTTRISLARNYISALPWQAQDVAHPGHGVDERRPHLAAQVADVGLDHAVVAAEVVLPHVIQDLPLRQHPARVGHQVPQQRVLRRRQIQQAARPGHLVRVLVDAQVGVAEHTARADPGR